MGEKSGYTADLPVHHEPGPGAADALAQADLVARLHAELEQAQVTIEDMDLRLTALAEANAELHVRLAEETRRRITAEQQAQQPQVPDDADLRHELAVSLEELQVMLEELQSAHDALSGESAGG